MSPETQNKEVTIMQIERPVKPNVKNTIPAAIGGAAVIGAMKLYEEIQCNSAIQNGLEAINATGPDKETLLTDAREMMTTCTDLQDITSPIPTIAAVTLTALGMAAAYAARDRDRKPKDGRDQEIWKKAVDVMTTVSTAIMASSPGIVYHIAKEGINANRPLDAVLAIGMLSAIVSIRLITRRIPAIDPSTTDVESMPDYPVYSERERMIRKAREIEQRPRNQNK